MCGASCEQARGSVRVLTPAEAWAEYVMTPDDKNAEVPPLFLGSARALACRFRRGLTLRKTCLASMILPSMILSSFLDS